MRDSLFWSIFYTIIAATLYICVIFDPIPNGYKTTEYALGIAIIISLVDIYYIRRTIKRAKELGYA